MRIIHKVERYSLRAIVLLGLAMEMVDDITGLTSLRGRRGIYDFSRKLQMGEYQFRSAIESLEKQLLIKKTGGGFLITPKGKKKIKFLKLQRTKAKEKQAWDKKWRVVIFDIPEDARQARDIFRSLLKRKGFIRLQNSVFISPYGDFDELNEIRHEYGIQKYVNFLMAKADEVENDQNLRNRFNLDKE